MHVYLNSQPSEGAVREHFARVQKLCIRWGHHRSRRRARPLMAAIFAAILSSTPYVNVTWRFFLDWATT